MRKYTRWRYAVTLAAAALAVVSCSEQTRNPMSPSADGGYVPVFTATVAGNGAGKCLKADVIDYYGDGPVNCTANDISIATTTVSQYSFTGAPGSFVTLNPGDRISCTEGQHIFVNTSAILENSAQERYDVGVWISLGLTAADTSALNGTNCNHYNVLNTSSGATNLDNDQCGDMLQGDSAVVPLDVLELVCHDPDGNGALEVKGCVAWDNSNTGQEADHACPVTDNPQNLAGSHPTPRESFVWGTLPNTPAKCNCEPFQLPIDVLQTAHLEVRKVCVPTTDNGTFDLDIDGGTLEVDNGACGATTGSVEVGAGSTGSPGATHNFSESGFTTANYTSSYACVNRAGGGARGSGTTLGPNEITLQPNDDVICTFTNSRKPGKIELVKSLSPTNDPGLFNLFIKNSVPANVATASNVGNGGTTGAGGTSLPPGTYNLSETAGTATSLSDYTTTGPACVNRVGGGSVTVTSGNVTINSNDDIVCTITNTRNTGKIELKKALVPTNDPGLFNLFIKNSVPATVASATDVGNNGTTGAGGTTLNTGTYNLSETAGTGTSIGDYGVTGPVCVNRVGGGSVTVTSGNVTLAKDADIVCTITNTRNPGKIELIKSLSPTSDPGKFNLFIRLNSSGGAIQDSATDVGNNGTTGAGGTSLAPGNYFVGEAAGTGTAIGDYTVTPVACVNRVGGGSVASPGGVVTLASNADVVCTIVNTRNPGKIELRKATDPTTDTGKFNLFIRLNSGAGAIQDSATDVSNGGTTGAGGTTLPVGNYHLSEAAGTGTSLDDYVVSAVSCVNRSGGSVASPGGVVALASNADVVCTITNSKKAKLIVQKVITGGGTQSFDFSTGPAPGAASFSLTDGGSHDSGFTLTPGTYKVCELNLAVLWGATATVNGSPATLYNPDAAIPEDNGSRCTDVTVAYGSTTTVVFTNTPQQTGETRTIGYWKNWSSCTKGMQYIKATAPNGAGAEATLDFYLGGAGVHSIYPIGNISTLTCLQAVALLSKSSIDGTKRPGDPIYNMVAQLLGAKLNIAAGAGTCPILDQALIDAQNLLVAISFDGTKSYTGKNPTGTATATQLSTATTLAGILAAYNQGDLTGNGCPAHV